MKYHFTSIRITKIDQTNHIQWRGRCGTAQSLSEMKNGTVSLENSLAVSYKVKHRLVNQTNNHTPRYLSK